MPREFLHDPTFRARFEREARTIAALEHPAIVPVYDFGEEEGQPYIVMRLMIGGSLADRLAKGPLSLAESARIFGQLAPALDRAHAKGIIHRDLKPGNILFDEDGHPYISDFGIAKLTAATAAFTGTAIVGTPAYMSPEQARGDREIDGRSDIYALGAIVFQMLTGKLPFDADTPMGIALKHITEPAPSVREANASLPDSCEDLIQMAMAKSRDDRYPKAVAMAHALDTIASGHSLPKRAETPMPPTVRVPPPAALEPTPPTRAAPKPAASPASTVLPPQRIVAKSAVARKTGAGSIVALAIIGVLGLIAVGVVGLFIVLSVAPPSQLAPTAREAAATEKPTEESKPPARTPLPEQPAAGTISGTLTLWYGYGSDSSEESALQEIVTRAEVMNPDLEVLSTQVPFEDFEAKYLTAFAAGVGPDLIIFPNDNLGQWARDGAVLRLTPLIKDRLENYSTAAVEGMMESFRAGNSAMIIDGPWSLNHYRSALGDQLGVAVMPRGPGGPARPFNGIDGFYVNPNSANIELAVELALFLTNAESSQIFTDIGGHIPIRSDVKSGDPLIATFAEASTQGFPRPQSKEFGNFWGPFGDAWTKVMEGTRSPAGAVAEACAAMNYANGK
ncbi:MAG: extracellular solute-binding protein [Chloroflexi bacterium]|nr:extracellular solute-binding protein [Chloroflexota bacterium]